MDINTVIGALFFAVVICLACFSNKNKTLEVDDHPKRMMKIKRVGQLRIFR